MHGEAVKEIAGLAASKVSEHQLGARKVLVSSGVVIADAITQHPMPATLVVHTLTGLRDYLASNRDKLDPATVAVHVVSPTRVDLVSATLDETKQRAVHVRAEAYNRMDSVAGFKFGQFLNAETMTIALMAMFEESDDRLKLIQLLSNVEQGAVRTDEDDGISQTVKARMGISMVAEKRVPNPVTLTPFRTFVEIVQPSSQFVFRMKASSEGDKAGAALFEADGGAWRDEATDVIAQWLRDNLPEGVAVLA